MKVLLEHEENRERKPVCLDSGDTESLGPFSYEASSLLYVQSFEIVYLLSSFSWFELGFAICNSNSGSTLVTTWLLTNGS